MEERTLRSGAKQPQRLDDFLFLASATKLITTVAALQCVEDGLLTLAGDLLEVVPDLVGHWKQVLTGFSEDGETPLLEPAVRPTTLEMLLTHTSGLPYDFLNPDAARWNKKFKTLSKGERRPLADAFGYLPVFQPGAGC